LDKLISLLYCKLYDVVKRCDVRQDKEKSINDVMREEAVDIRLFPIDFFANNMFCATGVNKVLRGHYGVNDQDQLWFQVSVLVWCWTICVGFCVQVSEREVMLHFSEVAEGLQSACEAGCNRC
jgi:hypothetical protein